MLNTVKSIRSVIFSAKIQLIYDVAKFFAIFHIINKKKSIFIKNADFLFLINNISEPTSKSAIKTEVYFKMLTV